MTLPRPSPHTLAATPPRAEETVVTLIIPLRRQLSNFENCLASLSRQTYPHHLIQIHFLDDQSSPDTRKLVREFVKSHPRFRVLRRAAKSTRGARHFAAADEWVIPVNPNAELAGDFIEQVIAEAKTQNADFIGGRMFYRDRGYFSRAVAAVLGSTWTGPIATQDLQTHAVRVEGGKHAAVRRSAMQHAGVLEHEMLGNEYEVALRLTQHGHRCHFSPKIISAVPLRGHVLDLLGHALWHGYAWSNRLKKQPSAFRLRFVLPGLMVLLALALGLSVTAGFFKLPLLLAWVSAFGFYNVFVSFAIAVKGRWQQLPLLPILLAAYQTAFGIGSIAGLITAKRWGSAIPKWLEKTAVVVSDYAAINTAFILWTYLRTELGLFSFTNFETAFTLSNLVYVFWFLLFLLLGLYRAWNAASRFDEALAVFKATALGVLLIFLVTFDVEHDWQDPLPRTRMLLLNYGLLVAGAVTLGRMIVRSIQRHLLENGLGLQRTLIVGWGRKARELYTEVSKYPALGFQVVGFVDIAATEERKQFQGIPLLGRLQQLSQIIRMHEVEEVLIALQQHDQKALMQVIAQTDGLPVHLKIVPDLYGIITGQARTNQIYGFPLIEILPQYMPTWERVTKRAIDFVVSSTILILGAPLWICWHRHE
jgi:cellulose synthase/poly-beta-1,6-N-acetylglucosamine synthase-like glycosyltransferase